MKKLLLPFIVCLPFAGFGQVQAPEIDLKLEQVAKERLKERDKAEMQLLIGATLSTLGVGIGLIGPMFSNEPVDPTGQYLNDVRLAGNNTGVVSELTRQYQKDIATFNDKAGQYERNLDTCRLLGTGVFAVGQGFNLGGIIKLVRNSN